ncbi:hypothetical protein Bca4012_027430 [Brassica carinata]
MFQRSIENDVNCYTSKISTKNLNRRVMIWRRVWESFQAVSANGFIFSFTLLLALKLDHLLSHSWWFVFTPFWWLCHAVISRGRFSLPSPPMPHDENWTPFQYVMATPMIVAFEILFFVYLEDKYARAARNARHVRYVVY